MIVWKICYAFCTVLSDWERYESLSEKQFLSADLKR